jgi:hypothetical protein
LGRVPLPFIGYFGLGDLGHKNQKKLCKNNPGRRDVPLLLLLIGIHTPNIKRTLAYDMQPGGLLYLLESAY